MAFGRSLELFFVDGKPEGILTAKVFNWTGQILKAPRGHLKRALERPEASHTGVYILLGDKDGQPLAYIGESEEIATRIVSHDAKKDWWTTALLITAAGNDLHKAHAKYLENRLIERAHEAAQIALENANIPARASLSEASIANMEEFLDTLYIVLPALGVDLFAVKKRAEHAPLAATQTAPTLFTLTSAKHKIQAQAQVVDGEFIVFKGSQARLKWIGPTSHNEGYAALHDKLLQAGILTTDDDHATFTESYAFSSPSAAASVIYGRAANGRTEWTVLSDGRSYKAWEESELSGLIQ